MRNRTQQAWRLWRDGNLRHQNPVLFGCEKEGDGVQRKQTQGTCAGDGHQSYSAGCLCKSRHWRAEATDVQHVRRSEGGV